MAAVLVVLLMCGMSIGCIAFVFVNWRKAQSELEMTQSDLDSVLGDLGKVQAELARYQTDFAGVIDTRKACENIIANTEHEEFKINERIKTKLQRLQDIKNKIDSLLPQRDDLQQQVKALDEEANLQSFGYYEPKYDFPSASRYQIEMKANKDAQKLMIKDKTAAVCHRDWTVDGSLAKGRQMVASQIRIMLRAFNSECDAAMSRIKYNNVETMEKRITRSCEALNKMMRTGEYEITQDYLNLKLRELWLLYEFAQKKRDEAEEQKLIKEQMQEEAKAEKALEKAKNEAAREENTFRKALEKARAQARKAVAGQQAAFQQQILELQRQLEEAQERSQRAISQAQLTRSGHVYIISNIGSFGEGVYKIGMTRRLEPMLRVKELGDASVPFPFDVHAMIYSKDAPALESQLHQMFDARRVNKINRRKEYFRVTLDEIEQAVHQFAGDVDFVRLADAEEFRKTKAQERANTHQNTIQPVLH